MKKEQAEMFKQYQEIQSDKEPFPGDPERQGQHIEESKQPKRTPPRKRPEIIKDIEHIGPKTNIISSTLKDAQLEGIQEHQNQ